MDKASKKSSSTTSNSLYMSANEMEMDDMSNPESKLLKSSDSKQETIEEDVKEELSEVITLRAGESAAEAPVVEHEDEDGNEEDALLNQTSPDVQVARGSQETVKIEDEEEQPMLDTTEGVEQMEIEEPARAPNSPEELFERFREAYADYGIFIIGGALLLLAFLFTLVVLPNCFYSLYYDEYALARSTLTGSVDSSEVYGPGWHIMAPWYEWIKFYKTVHTIKLKKLDIYSTDQLMVQGSFLVYYFLDKNTIGKLYRNHGTNYEQVIHNVCKSEILNQAQTFSINDFRRNRPEIKEFIAEKIRVKLEAEYGLKLFNFFMNELIFDKAINEINLKNILNDILNEKAIYDKNTIMAQTETERLVKEYKNLARAIYVGATLNGTYGVMKPANVEYDEILQTALSESLVKSYEGLGMNNDKIKMSYCWMSSLVYNPKVKFYQPSTNEETNTNKGPYANPISIIV